MKSICKRSLFILPLILTSCFSSKKMTEVPSVPFEITPQSIMEPIYALAHDSLAGRELGSEQGIQTAYYLAFQLQQLDISPFFSSYFDTLTTTKTFGMNVLGILEGNDPELKDQFLLIGAHFDHVGYGRKVDGDSIANGANDNASGVSAVINIAQYFSRHKSNGRSLVFAFFDGEEKGLLGAHSLALRMRNDSIKPQAVLNFDMIGTPIDAHPGKVYASGFDRTGLPAFINALAGDSVLVKTKLDQQMGIFAMSDNYPFYRVLKIPAHTLSTFEFRNYRYYHHVDDEPDKLDVQNMVTILDGLIPVIEKLSLVDSLDPTVN